MRLEEHDNFRNLKQNISEIVWNYLRHRLHVALPPADYSLVIGVPRTLGSYSIGSLLGHGAYGVVMKLYPLGSDPEERRVDPALGNRGVTFQEMCLALTESNNGMELTEAELWHHWTDLPEPEVSQKAVTILPKVEKTHLVGLKTVATQISIWKRLSSEDQAHPNLVKLEEVMHSETHLFFIMQYGGSENLYQRLSCRAERPLSSRKTKDIIVQCSSGLSYMHMVVQTRIVLRDIKPEAILVTEASGKVTIKFSDFDVARLVPHTANARSVSKFGTFPFTAPEVHIAQSHDALAADIWSMGCVFLEVTCSVHIIERNVFHSTTVPGCFDAERLLGLYERIHSYFNQENAVRSILEQHLQPDMQHTLEHSNRLLAGMLDVHEEQRWNAEQMRVGVEVFSDTSPA
jgi:serine/threonine protein kinase